MLVGVLDPFVKPHSGTPTFSPGAGSYGSTQSVTISATGGSVICYNTTGSPATNGTTGCTTGTLYTGAVSVSTSETLYAVSGGTGYTDSPVGSATYTISAGPSYVLQSTNSCSGYNSGTLTCAVGGTGIQSTSHVMVALVTLEPVSGCGSTTTSITSSKATWTSRVTSPTSGTSASSTLFSGVPSSTGADTLSVSFPAVGGCIVTVQIAEFAPSSTGAFDKSASSSGLGTGVTSTATGTLSHSSEIVIGGAFACYDSASNFTAINSYTPIGSGVNDLNGCGAVMSYYFTSATTAQTAQWTLDTTHYWTAGVMTLY